MKEKSLRLLGIDYGDARIGLALSDPSQTLASPFQVVRTQKNLTDTVGALLEATQAYTFEKIVVGLPLLLSGKESAMTTSVRTFATFLEEKSGLSVILQDERLTSREVERVLKASNLKRKARARHLDTLSATLILQTYLDASRVKVP